jgi:hypothetical protein
MNFYAHEKIRELESELKSGLKPEPVATGRRLLVGGLAAGAGHLLRRAGEGLESWSLRPGRECDPATDARFQ